jgi:hypothetical protein
MKHFIPVPNTHIPDKKIEIKAKKYSEFIIIIIIMNS